MFPEVYELVRQGTSRTGSQVTRCSLFFSRCVPLFSVYLYLLSICVYLYFLYLPVALLCIFLSLFCVVYLFLKHLLSLMCISNLSISVAWNSGEPPPL